VKGEGENVLSTFHIFAFWQGDTDSDSICKDEGCGERMKGAETAFLSQ
jgi:hypothetical protein